MNKTNLLKIITIIILALFISCNSDKPDSSEYDDGYITADYITNSVEDFYISSDNEVYCVTHIPSNAINLSIRKLDINGNVIVAHPDNSFLGGIFIEIASSNNETFYVIGTHLTGRNIYEYSTSTMTTNTYTMPHSLINIETFSDETYIFSDRNYVLREFNPTLNTAPIIAGSGTSALIDGEGINASFLSISKIAIKDEIIYVIDGGNNIRKIEKIGSSFTVSTIISDYPNSLKNISVNDNGDLFVLINEQGIYKLNSSDNSLEGHLSGSLNFKNNNSHYGTNWGSLNSFAIKNNDIYFQSFGKFVKISNYEEKFNQ